jgi:hypothetical protein
VEIAELDRDGIPFDRAAWTQGDVLANLLREGALAMTGFPWIGAIIGWHIGIGIGLGAWAISGLSADFATTFITPCALAGTFMGGSVELHRRGGWHG